MSGREILIKAVVQASPIYAMNLFKFPVSLCNKLQSIITKFWWGGAQMENKIHWTRWQHLCQSKSEGGMDFRNLVNFNQALIEKQGWRIFTRPNDIISQVLKYKYFPCTNF